MLIELGNAKPHHAPEGIITALPGPAVTSVGVSDAKKEDGSYVVGFVPGISPIDVLRQFALNKGGVMHLGGNEAVQAIISEWDNHSTEPPSWVSVVAESRDPENAAALQGFLAEYWGATQGKPEDFEDSHFTQYDGTIYSPGDKP